MGVNVGTMSMALAGANAAYQGFRGFQQSGLLRENAAITEANAPYVRAAAKEKARQLQTASYLMQGRQKSGYAASGLAVGGSVFDLMNDTATNYTRDATFALMEGELEARGMQRQADLYRIQARNAMRDGIVGGMLNFGSSAVNLKMMSDWSRGGSGGGSGIGGTSALTNTGGGGWNPMFYNRMAPIPTLG